MADLASIRLITAVAHSVPGTVLDLHCCDGTVLTVASGRLHAHLDPCELRAAVLGARRVGRPRLVDTVTDVTVRAGLEDLGGGLYRRQGPDGEERWFATSMEAEHVREELLALPFGPHDGDLAAALHPDRELGVTVVRVTGTGAGVHRLDEVGFRALAACMVAETLRVVMRRSGRP